MQGRERFVVENPPVHLLAVQLDRLRAPPARTAQSDVLLADLVGQQRPVRAQTAEVGHHHARHHHLAEPPRRLDDPLLGARGGVAGEQHPRRRGVHEPLQGNRDPGRALDAQTLTVGQGRAGVGGRVHLPDRSKQAVERGDVQNRGVLSREARVLGVLAHCRRACGGGPAQPCEDLRQRRACAGVVVHHTVQEADAQREPVGYRQARAQRPPEAHGLAAVARHVLRRDERRPAGHRISTTPSLPSTRTLAPSGMSRVAERVPTTAGMPYSRATMAA